MIAYMIRRTVLIIPTLLLVTVFVFLSVRFIPGDVIDLLISETNTEGVMTYDQARGQLESRLGLDKPIHVQYWNWLTQVVRGNLGTSIRSGNSITSDILTKVPISIELGLWAMLTGLLIALPIGIYSAIRQDTVGDYVGRTVAILAMSLPGFWIMTMAIIFPAIWWGWSPPVEYIPFAEDPLGNTLQFALPGLIMGLSFSGGLMRMMRTLMLEVLRQDYIRTAWAKGLSERVIIIRHALKNALIPVVTIVGMGLPGLVAGAVITEQIFNLPGMGRYLFDAINRRDYPIISAVNLVLATLILFCNLLVDLTYGWLDPRVQYQ